MATIRVYLLQELIQAAGTHVLEFKVKGSSTVREILKRLPVEVREKVLDMHGNIKYPVEVMVNGRRIDFLDGLDTRVEPGDTIHISPRALFVV